MGPKRAIRLLSLTPALVGVFVFILFAANANSFVLGVSAGPVSLGGSSYAQGKTVLKQKAESFLLSPVSLTQGQNTVAVTPGEIGFRINTDAALAEAWGVGRSGIIVTDIAEQTAALISSPDVPLTAEEDPTQFEQTMRTALSDIDEPATNAGLRWNALTGRFDEVAAAEGRVADIEPIRIAILDAAPRLQPVRSLGLVMINDTPEISDGDLTEGRVLFSTILDQLPLTVTADDYQSRLTRTTVAPWLMLTTTSTGIGADIDTETAKTWLMERIAVNVNREPQNAVFETGDTGRVHAFALAKDGQKLDTETSVTLLREHLLSATEDSTDVSLPVLVTKPALGNDSAEELGIVELLAVGETNFSGSPANRIHNIGIGASRYDGLLLEPGQEFSFNQFLGPVNAETGYKPELVIKPEGTVPEYGGGLCQVSTTAFQAAVQAGLSVTQRRNHSYMVRYYGAPGFDATIYPPYTDLKFVNDTPAHMLIQTEVIGTTIRFYYYGTDDGREVDIDGPHTLTINNDGSGSAVLGVTTSWPDGRTEEQVFRSYYRSPALYPRAQQNPLE